MATTVMEPQPLVMTADQRQALQHFSVLLARRAGNLARVVVTDATGEQDELSGQEASDLAAALYTALQAFASEDPVEVIPADAELTTTQAARTLRGSGYLAVDGNLPPDHTHHAIAAADKASRTAASPEPRSVFSIRR